MIADINGAMTMADLGEYHDWAVDDTTPEWGAGNDNVCHETMACGLTWLESTEIPGIEHRIVC